MDTSNGMNIYELESSAITEYTKLLENKGYSIVPEVQRREVDITALKDGKCYYFEIKATTKHDQYFGAATLSEWKIALDNQEYFWFVVAEYQDGGFRFKKFTPQEFAKYSTVPPFKVNFNIHLDNLDYETRHRNSTITVGNDFANPDNTLIQLLEWDDKLRAK